MDQLLSTADVYNGNACGMAMVGAAGGNQLGRLAHVPALYRGCKVGVDVGPVD